MLVGGGSWSLIKMCLEHLQDLAKTGVTSLPKSSSNVPRQTSQTDCCPVAMNRYLIILDLGEGSIAKWEKCSIFM